MREVIPSENSEPTAEEIAAAAKTLSKLRPGFLPLPLFLETVRLVPAPIVEIVPLRKVDGRVQVLLTKREDDDPTWPGMLHTPGTVVRSTDEEGSYKSAFNRILEGELSSIQLASDPQYVCSLLHRVKRGMEDATVFYVEVAGDPEKGTFYDIDDLPENVVDTQIDFIQSAAKSFTS